MMIDNPKSAMDLAGRRISWVKLEERFAGDGENLIVLGFDDGSSLEIEGQSAGHGGETCLDIRMMPAPAPTASAPSAPAAP